MALWALLSESKKFTSIGGQAVIEGVMMRSPHFLAIALRKPDGKIILKEQRWKSISQKFPLLKKPFIRGVVGLIESMFNGIEALSFSANIAAKHDPTNKNNDEEKEISKLAMIGSIVFAFAMGMLLFVAAPHFITMLFGKWGLFDRGIDNPLFHAVDGVIKVLFLLIYIYSISLMKDVYRVFQYHGAEHKSIYSFEADEDLTVANARRHTTLHPRCGTSFLLFLLVISIVVFSAVFPLVTPSISSFLGLASSSPIVHIALVFVKIVLMMPVAGISYEFIKASSCRMQNPVFKALVYPGLLLQNLTTREPDDQQLEVALVSLRRVLFLEKNPDQLKENEFEIEAAQDIQSVVSNVSEFPEL